MKYAAFGLGAADFYTRRTVPKQRAFRVRAIRRGLGAPSEYEVMALDAAQAVSTVLAAGYTLAVVLE